MTLPGLAAAALVSLSQAYQAGGRNARESLLLQKLLPVFNELTGTMKAVKIDRLTLLGGSGNGGSVPIGRRWSP